jgi:hypothetical protein
MGGWEGGLKLKRGESYTLNARCTVSPNHNQKLILCAAGPAAGQTCDTCVRVPCSRVAREINLPALSPAGSPRMVRAAWGNDPVSVVSHTPRSARRRGMVVGGTGYESDGGAVEIPAPVAPQSPRPPARPRAAVTSRPTRLYGEQSRTQQQYGPVVQSGRDDPQASIFLLGGPEFDMVVFVLSPLCPPPPPLLLHPPHPPWNHSVIALLPVPL